MFTTLRERLTSTFNPKPLADLDQDDIYGALSNSRRRLIIDYVAQLDDADHATTRKLSAYIAAEEHDKPVDDVTSDDRKSVYIAIYQGHIPELDSLGIIAADGHEITATPATQAVNDIRRETRDRLGGDRL